MALLPPEAFAHVFEPLRNKRIGYVRPIGNVGDALIEWATFQLFDHFQIEWKLVDARCRPCQVDELVFGGGGNMGTMWQNNWDLRTQCLRWGLPLTILPQSFTTREDRTFQRIYVRERASLALAGNAILAPDLALGLQCDTTARPRRRLGVFLRKDSEGVVRRTWRARDPVKLCRTPQEYLALAGRYEQIVTDRLHFAICGLLHGRPTTLLPNSYNKNISMFDTWLKDLGCQFALRPRAVPRRAA